MKTTTTKKLVLALAGALGLSFAGTASAIDRQDLYPRGDRLDHCVPACFWNPSSPTSKIAAFAGLAEWSARFSTR